MILPIFEVGLPGRVDVTEEGLDREGEEKVEDTLSLFKWKG